MGRSNKQDADKKHKRFEQLDEAWRADMLGRKNPQDLRDEILRAAMNTMALEAAKDLDDDLAQLKEQVAEASAVYTDGKKQNKLKMEFLIDTLRGQGHSVPGAEDFLHKAAARKLNAEIVGHVSQLKQIDKNIAELERLANVQKAAKTP